MQKVVRLDPKIASLDERTLRELLLFVASMGLSLGYVKRDGASDLLDFIGQLPVRSTLKQWLERKKIPLFAIDSKRAHFESFHAGEYENFFEHKPALVATSQQSLDLLWDDFQNNLVEVNPSLLRIKDSTIDTFIGAGASCLDARLTSLSKCWLHPFRIKKDEASKYDVLSICHAFAKVNPQIRIYDKLFLTCFLRRNRHKGQKTALTGLLDAKDLLLGFLDVEETEEIQIITEFNPNDGFVTKPENGGPYTEREKKDAIEEIEDLLRTAGRDPKGLILLNKYSETNPCDTSHIWGITASLEWPHFAVSFGHRTKTEIRAIPSDINEMKAEEERQELVKQLRINNDW